MGKKTEASVKVSDEYRARAEREIQEARVHLQSGFLESAISTAYYSCFYAIHSHLARLGVEAGSHKQAGIEFRRLFIKTGRLPVQLSEALQELSSWRLEVDYAPSSGADKARAGDLVLMAEEFVSQVLGVTS